MQEKKVNMYILIWVILIFLLLLLNQFKRNVQLKNELSSIRTSLKKELEDKINARNKTIAYLSKKNESIKSEIDKLNKTIDSLKIAKAKTKIRYVNIIKNIKNMDAEQIKKYWNEEFD